MRHYNNAASSRKVASVLCQILLMMITIMLVFGVCWLPYQIAVLYNEHRTNQHLQVSFSLRHRLL